MKKFLSVLLSVLIAITCISGVNYISFADTDVVDDNNDYDFDYNDWTAPDKPYVACTQTGPTCLKLSLEQYGYNVGEQLEIRKYNASTGKYDLLKTVKGDAQSYTLYNLNKDTAYKLSVTAIYKVGDHIISSEPVYISARTSPAETSVTSLKYVSTGKMQVKWKKVSGVSGYIIKYSLDSKMGNNAKTCTHVVTNQNTTSLNIAGLAKGIYYVSVATFKTLSSVKYCSLPSIPKTVSIKAGATVKSMLNAVGTDNSGRVEILELTNKGVDISKYSTTYDKVKAIYNWHSKHNTDYGWSCMQCNANFNSCISALFQNSRKSYDRYIYLAAGNFKNNGGSVVMHKWSVLYLAGKPYIFDPRLQGYTSNKTGNDYFGIERGGTKSKPYLFDYWMFYWEQAKTFAKSSESICSSVARPAKVTVDKATPAKKAFTVRWQKVSGASGYQLIYSTNKNFSSYKTVDISSGTTLSRTVKNLPSGKTYYVKVRAYKMYGKTKVFGAPSAVKSLKTK